MDMFKMLGKLGEVQERMNSAKEKLKTIIIEESELDGVVIVRMSADRQVKEIKIRDDFYTKYTPEEREDILTECLNNALEKAEARGKEEMNESLKGVVPNIPGLDMSNLPFGL